MVDLLSWLPPWLYELLVPRLDFWVFLGIAFVAGNFATATLSDLRHLSAQQEFLTTWEVIFVLLLAYDLWINADALLSGKLVFGFMLKYGLIAVLCVISHQRVGILHSLATGDVVALACASALFSPVLVMYFFVLVKLFDLLERPLLRRAGHGDSYPFMPVIFTALLVVLLTALVLAGHL